MLYLDPFTIHTFSKVILVAIDSSSSRIYHVRGTMLFIVLVTVFSATLKEVETFTLSSRNSRMLRYNTDRFVYYLPTFLLMQLRYPTNIRRTPVIRVLSKGWHSTPARLCRRVYNYRSVHRDDVGVSNGHLPLSAGSQAILTALSCLIILRTHSTP